MPTYDRVLILDGFTFNLLKGLTFQRIDLVLSAGFTLESLSLMDLFVTDHIAVVFNVPLHLINSNNCPKTCSRIVNVGYKAFFLSLNTTFGSSTILHHFKLEKQKSKNLPWLKDLP